MTVFNCSILMTKQVFEEAKLKGNLIDALKSNIYQKFNLDMFEYSLYMINHNSFVDEKTKGDMYIFNCILHIFE